MRMTRIAVIIRIPVLTPIAETTVREIAFDASAGCAVGRGEVPVPGAADQVEGAEGQVRCEVAFYFEGLAEADEVVGEFGGEGPDADPVLGEGGGD